MSFYCQRTRLHSSWAELSSGRTDGWSDGRMVGWPAWRSCFQAWFSNVAVAAKADAEVDVDDDVDVGVGVGASWDCDVDVRASVNLCHQSENPNWKIYVRVVVRVCVCVCGIYATHGTHTHIYAHVLFIIFFVGKCDLYENLSISDHCDAAQCACEIFCIVWDF